MHTDTDTEKPKKKAVSLTISEDVISTARDMKLNTSRAAESGIRQAIREQKEQQWREDNKDGIASYNEWTQKNGILLRPSWDQ